MSANIETVIQEKIHVLPLDQKKAVLAFIEDLEKRPTPLQRLGQIIDEHFKDLPPEDLEKLPVDGSLNLDHYLYGSPKK